jgi:hypothetical protein
LAAQLLGNTMIGRFGTTMNPRDSRPVGRSGRDAGEGCDASESALAPRSLNVGGGILLLVVTSVIAVVQAQYSRIALPLTLSYPTAAPGAGMPPEIVAVPAVDAGMAAVVVLAIAALARLVAATPMVHTLRAETSVLGRNPLRWIEYAATSAIMIFVIAQLNGITEVSTLVLIYTLQSASVILLWLQERLGAASRSVQPFVFASVVGIVPWGIMALHVLAPGATSGYDQPLWVRVFTVSMLLLFSALVANQWGGVRPSAARAGRLRVERGYLVLGIVMPVAFASQMLGGIIVSSPIAR